MTTTTTVIRKGIADMKAQNVVKRARQDLDLSQEDFAKLLGYERKSIIRFEQGERVPQRVLLAITQLLQQHKRKK